MKHVSSILVLMLTASSAFAAQTALDGAFAGTGRSTITAGTYYKGVLAHLPKSDGGSIMVTNFHDVDANGNQTGVDTIYLRHFAASGAEGASHSVLASAAHFALVGGAAIDSQGRIIVVGSTTSTFSASNFRVVRVLSNGVLDTSFDGDGIAEIDFAAGGLSDDRANAVAIDSLDRIVVVGEVERATTGDFDFGIARFTVNGAPDPGFGGGDGKLTTHFDLGSGLRYDRALAVAIGSDGRITVAGTAYDSAVSVTRIALARLTDTGTLDSSFCPASCNFMGSYTGIHSGRRVIFYGSDTPARSDQVAAISLRNDGALLIAGTTPGTGETLGYIMRLAANGNWTNEVATQGGTGAGGTVFVGGVHSMQPSNPSSDIVLTGSSGPNEEFFFAQRFDALLFPVANWGTIGPSSSVYLWTAGGAFGDVGDNRPGRSAVDAQGRVLVGGRYKVNLPTNPYSAVAARLTSTDPVAADIFKNGFE